MSDPSEIDDRAKEPVSAAMAGPYGHPFHPMLVTVPIGAWVCSLVFDIAARFVAQPQPFAEGARWLIAIGVVGPLLAVLEVTFALMVSSRVNDPRVAEQISMVIIVPLLAGFFGQMAGLFILDRQLISVVAIVMLALDALMVYLAVQAFQREAILTRWK